MIRWTVLLLLFLVSCAPPIGVNDPLPIDGNQPYIIDKGDEQGVLLIHGLSATPWEVTPIANYLAQRNVTVVVTLLAGHGTTMAELNSATWPEWYASANDSLTILKHKTQRVYVAGVSEPVTE